MRSTKSGQNANESAPISQLQINTPYQQWGPVKGFTEHREECSCVMHKYKEWLNIYTGQNLQNISQSVLIMKHY
jgi:hypothetical protein